jgi:hypothetical protein
METVVSIEQRGELGNLGGVLFSEGSIIKE